MPTAAQLEAELIGAMASLASDPLLFAKTAYPWGHGRLATVSGPRKWQADILGEIGAHLRSNQRFQPLQIAVASGHGIGKTALIAMVIGWAMSTCDDCMVLVTAGTGKQLETKTIPEVNKWFRDIITAHWWDVRATSIRAKDKGHESTWRTDYVSWSEENPEAFQGLHNQGKRIVVILDEASAIAPIIWETIQGALTDEGTEIIVVAFGNPTRNTGNFRECFGAQAHRWVTRQIDSRTVEGTNKTLIAKWAEDYGEDSDYFRVRVRGEFPRAGSDQFIPTDIVAACRKHKSQGHEHQGLILAVDVARFGDDQTALGLRQGRKFQLVGKHRGLDTMQVADKVIAAIEEYGPDAVVIDGDGIGAGVVDRVKQLQYGRLVTEFRGGYAANHPELYFNRRAEIWGLMRGALKAGMEIPDLPELEADLTGIGYGLSGKGAIQLEKKEDMKRRGLSSPDLGDCLAMTFAVTVAPRGGRKKSKLTYPSRSEGAWMAA